ncbi:MAG: M48 family metalloprotease [Neptuniibacter sp.]
MFQKLHIKLAIITLSGCITACATPDLVPEQLTKDDLLREQTEQFKQALTYQNKLNARLAEVAYPLLKGSLEDCGKRTRFSIGSFLHKSSEYPKEQHTATTELYGNSDKVQILYALNAGASQGKLFKGDLILKINKQSIPDNSTTAAIKILKAAISDGAKVKLLVERQNETLTVAIQPEKVCDYSVVLSPSETINGYADGGRIIITSGLMRFAADNDQLALIIAHELAHNTLGHIPKRLSNGALGMVIDIVLTSSGFPSPLLATAIGANLYSQAFETEADLEAIRLLHNAGYNIKGLDNFWREMAMLHPSSITHNQSISHPTTVERALSIRQKIKELEKN